jgi:hypothetical protein
MKKLILVFSIFIFVLSSYSFAAEVEVLALSLPSGSAGMFCNVEGAEVCVVARTEEDCTKLGGKKVDSCPVSQEK